MFTDYINIKFISHSKKEEIPQESDKIQLITAQDKASHLELQHPITHRIENAFSKEETHIITTITGYHTLFVIIPNKATEHLRLAGASVYDSLKNQGIQTVTLQGLEDLTEMEGYSFLEGLILSSYDFNKYKTKKTKTCIQIYIDKQSFSEEKLVELQNVAEAISLTKTLVNEPGSYMNALQFSEVAIQAGKQFGFKTEIFHKDQIEALKMGGLLGVNQGSDTPPTFNVFHHKPEHVINKQPLILVGKGVMFDTGGYSLKTGGNMLTMKSDMAGGAAVLGTMAAIAKQQLPYHVIGLVPATDNKISSNALVVDDVITMMDGTTVEVQNTDAEGRLVLADALTYAKRFNPELVIDLATLTGASVAITGSFGIAVLGNDQEKIDKLKRAGDHVYERLIQLPLWEEYRDLLKSEIAEMSNLGGPIGGVSTSSIFLEHFTDYPWIHLDIAGAAFVKDKKGYRQSGATSVPVRLLFEFISRQIKK